jgi:hypothetical protein
LCWGYRSRDDRRAAVVAWLRDGLASGHHAWYVAEGTPEELLGDLAELPDRDAHLARGALRVDAAAAVYGTGTVSSDVQLRVYDDEVTAALAAGATGLRVAADVSCLVGDPRRRAGHLRWEHVSDRYAARRPFSAMCMYDLTTVADDAAEALVCPHPLRRERERAVRLTAFADGATVALAAATSTGWRSRRCTTSSRQRSTTTTTPSTCRSCASWTGGRQR